MGGDNSREEVMSLENLTLQHWAAMERARIAAFGFIVPDMPRRQSRPAPKLRSPKRRPIKKRRSQKIWR